MFSYIPYYLLARAVPHTICGLSDFFSFLCFPVAVGIVMYMSCHFLILLVPLYSHTKHCYYIYPVQSWACVSDQFVFFFSFIWFDSLKHLTVLHGQEEEWSCFALFFLCCFFVPFESTAPFCLFLFFFYSSLLGRILLGLNFFDFCCTSQAYFVFFFFLFLFLVCCLSLFISSFICLYLLSQS